MNGSGDESAEEVAQRPERDWLNGLEARDQHRAFSIRVSEDLAEQS